MCRKIESCQYTTDRMTDFRRHESTCTDSQEIVSQQVAYGDDKTPVKQLVEMGYLPEESLNFRKSFYTTFDIELRFTDLSA